MIRRNTRNVSRNVRSNERRSVITRRGSRRLDNEAQMARRTRRFRRYEEDEKEAGDEVENLIDAAETSDIVDKAVDALTGYDCPEKEYDDEEKEIKILRTKRFGMKPMYPEDACIQMELTGHDFFVFRNAETDEINVVYKRRGNTYGLIEPDF